MKGNKRNRVIIQPCYTTFYSCAERITGAFTDCRAADARSAFQKGRYPDVPA